PLFDRLQRVLGSVTRRAKADNQQCLKQPEASRFHAGSVSLRTHCQRVTTSVLQTLRDRERLCTACYTGALADSVHGSPPGRVTFTSEPGIISNISTCALFTPDAIKCNHAAMQPCNLT